MPRDIADTLRREILASGLSISAIAKASGVQQSTLSRFMAGADMGMSRGAKVACVLGLDLRRSGQRNG